MPVSVRLRRIGYRIAYRLLQVFWFVSRPEKKGVKCLVTDGDQVLLVRHTYGRRAWDIPGGATKRGEEPVVAAGREMFEELGLSDVQWRPLGEVRGSVDHRQDTIHGFHADLRAPALTIDDVELAQVGWFPRTALPADLGPYVAPIIERARLGDRS
jgi:ADP-ribose pyrophosphatase YjhB (NUDIX family)